MKMFDEVTSRHMKFANAVSEAIFRHNVKFSIFRSVNGKVETCEIRYMSYVWQESKMLVEYRLGPDVKCEEATQQDLMLISQQARQLEAKQPQRTKKRTR